MLRAVIRAHARSLESAIKLYVDFHLFIHPAAKNANPATYLAVMLELDLMILRLRLEFGTRDRMSGESVPLVPSDESKLEGVAFNRRGSRLGDECTRPCRALYRALIS